VARFAGYSFGPRVRTDSQFSFFPAWFPFSKRVPRPFIFFWRGPSPFPPCSAFPRFPRGFWFWRRKVHYACFLPNRSVCVMFSGRRCSSSFWPFSSVNRFFGFSPFRLWFPSFFLPLFTCVVTDNRLCFSVSLAHQFMLAPFLLIYPSPPTCVCVPHSCLLVVFSQFGGPGLLSPFFPRVVVSLPCCLENPISLLFPFFGPYWR